MSIAVGMQSIVAQSFPVVVESEINNNDFWKGTLPYFIFIAFIIAIIWLTKKYFSETKGRSLEELERFGKRSMEKLSRHG